MQTKGRAEGLEVQGETSEGSLNIKDELKTKVRS